MHPLNPYYTSLPDFTSLATKSKKFKDAIRHVKESPSLATVDFKDADSVRALTEAILEHDFGLQVTLRNDRLCPTVPNRLNYIAWIQELMDQTRRVSQSIQSGIYDLESQHDTDQDRPTKRPRSAKESNRVLDIGTGASVIYPILGCALHDWEFVATDIDAESLETAKVIINDPKNNKQSEGRLTKDKLIHLQDQVHLFLRLPNDDLFLSEKEIFSSSLETIEWPLKENLLYHATMCNPPFYSSHQEMQDSLNLKSQVPNAVCHGSRGEMICEGGEVAFIARMIEESRKNGNRVIWFTSMIGKLSSIDRLIDKLQQNDIDNYLFTEFAQGKTKRWAIAWSHLPIRISTKPMVPLPPSLQKIKNRITLRTIDFPLHSTPTTKEEILQNLLKRLDQLSIPYAQESVNGSVIVLASKDLWSRKARRAKSGQSVKDSLKDDLALGVRIDLRLHEQSSSDNILEAAWMYGRDGQLFEGFIMSVLRGFLQQYTKPAS